MQQTSFASCILSLEVPITCESRGILQNPCSAEVRFADNVATDTPQRGSHSIHHTPSHLQLSPAIQPATSPLRQPRTATKRLVRSARQWQARIPRLQLRGQTYNTGFSSVLAMASRVGSNAMRPPTRLWTRTARSDFRFWSRARIRPAIYPQRAADARVFSSWRVAVASLSRFRSFIVRSLRPSPMLPTLD